MMSGFCKDEHFLCPHAHEIEQLDQRRARGEMTAAEHAQAVRDLDPLDEVVIARMTVIAEGTPEKA